jgi:GntR family transcriptional repressor for pyruvate dehydrogenase complex
MASTNRPSFASRVHDDTPDRVTARILDLVQQRKLAPGDRLPSERELAQQLHISRPALRESLAALEAMRIVARRAHSGIFHAESGSPPSFESVVFRSELGLPLDVKTIAHSMEVRNMLEVHAVELACLRHTAADLDHLRAIVERTRVRLREGGTIMDLDEEFHFAVVSAAHNPVFLQVVHAFYRLSRERRDVYFSDMKRCRRSHREHRAIVEAIAIRDGARARRAMHAHIEEGFWASVVKQQFSADAL